MKVMMYSLVSVEWLPNLETLLPMRPSPAARTVVARVKRPVIANVVLILNYEQDPDPVKVERESVADLM